MSVPVAPTVLIIIIVVGSLVQLIWNRDDWPLSNYAMYSHLVSDRVKNPFVPLRREHDGEAAFFVLSIELADGTLVPMTTSYAHPLLMPYERLRILRHLITLYKRGEDVGPTMQRLAGWVHHRIGETGTSDPIRNLRLQMYLYKRIPEQPQRHHTPDEVIDIATAAVTA